MKDTGQNLANLINNKVAEFTNGELAAVPSDKAQELFQSGLAVVKVYTPKQTKGRNDEN